jgi:hypothetical protein
VSDTCAGAARAADEPLAGTAAHAQGWLLVEQPGAWGRDALTASGLDPAIGAALAARAVDVPVRVQTIRRAGGRPEDTTTSRTVLLVHTGATPWMERLTVDDVTDLAGLDPAVCASPTPPGLGSPDPGPLYLVCTHAKRDRCCATLGRPIADTLAALHREATWEVSHVGGHRFAGNLVVLPDGLLYGGLDVAGAVAAVDLHLAGRIDVGHLRGRSHLARPAQAAEVFVRRELALDRATAVGAIEVVEQADAGAVVDVTVADRRVRVEVTKEPLGTSFLTSCDADAPEDPGGYRLAGWDLPIASELSREPPAPPPPGPG